jgi:hypothetical protein
MESRCIRTWLFLASAWVQPFKDANKQQGILGKKACEKSRQGFASTDSAHLDGLEGGDDMGVLSTWSGGAGSV